MVFVVFMKTREADSFMHFVVLMHQPTKGNLVGGKIGWQWRRGGGSISFKIFER